MRFEWDGRKNEVNIRKYGLDFGEAAQMFSGSPLLFEPDTREDYGEDRWIGLGMIGPLVAVVVFSWRAPDVIRIISLRQADKDEQNSYYAQVF